MSAKLTPWFDCATAPDLPGVYEREISAFARYHCYAYWTGKHWCAYTFTPESARNQSHIRSRHQGGRWRGLAKAPKAPKANHVR